MAHDVALRADESITPPPAADEAVRVVEVTKTYGRTRALHGVSLSVAPGEVVALLGPNGAGKTTLLEMLVGLRRPDSGSVWVLGEDPQDRPASLLRRIALQPQGGTLFPHLTPIETLRLWSSLYPSSLDPEHVLALAGLEDKRGDQVRRLSGGQQQRLLLAVTLVGRPALVFLDEPTGALDPNAKHEIWTIIRTLQADGRTIVLATHSMDEAEALCDRVVVIGGGRIRAAGTPAELIRDHAPVQTVSFRTPRPGCEDALAAIPGVFGVAIGPSGVRLETRNADDTLRGLLRLDDVLAPREIRVQQATLEDAYLSLMVGRDDEEHSACDSTR